MDYRKEQMMQQMYQQMISSNPTFQQAARMVNNAKTPQARENLVRNICQQKGINISQNELMEQFRQFMGKMI